MGTNRAAVTPTSVETTLPPTTDQGWANGLAGTAKTSTADAPIGATSNGSGIHPCRATALTKLVSVTPITAPTHARSRSRRVAPARMGTKGSASFIFSDHLSGRSDVDGDVDDRSC